MRIINKTLVHDGFLKKYSLQLDNGNKIINREIVDRGDGVAALIYNTTKDSFVFVKQFRPGANEYIIELVAGTVEEEETITSAIEREILEEVGYKTDCLEFVSEFYGSPGSITEKVYLVYVEVSEKIENGGGVEDEEIEIVEVEKQNLSDLIKHGNDIKIEDAKTIIAIQWYILNKTK